MSAWPSSLSSPQRAGLAESFQDVVSRTPMSAGPAKQRRRFTAAGRTLTFALRCNAAQRSALLTFYRDTTKHGSLSFDYTDPNDSSAVTARFAAPPDPRRLAGELWDIQVSLEILP